MTALPIAAPLSPAMKMLAILPVILATILWQGLGAELADHLYYKKPVTAVSWHAFEPRLYSQDLTEVFRQEEQADGALDCSGYEYKDWKRIAGSWLERYSIPLTRRRNPNHTDSNGLLVMRVSVPINVRRPDVLFNALKEFAVERGFRRVLVLGNMGCGVPVLYDSAYKSQTPSDR